jgi:hypothetical protein
MVYNPKIMQATPDYTQQLNQIIAILSRPSTFWSTYDKLISSVIGVLIGATITYFYGTRKDGLERKRRTQKMRAVLYGELVQMYQTLVGFSCSDVNLWGSATKTLLRDTMDYSQYGQIRKDGGFYDLGDNEQVGMRNLYPQFEKLSRANSEGNDKAAFIREAYKVAAYFEMFLKDGKLCRRCVLESTPPQLRTSLEQLLANKIPTLVQDQQAEFWKLDPYES